MEQQHRRAIQSNFSSLVERTDLDSVVTALYEKEVFSEQMIEPYRDTSEPPRERKRKLYRDVMHRGPHAFRHLVDVLSELGYWDLVRDLDPNNPYSTFSRPPISSNPITSRESDRVNEGFVSISQERNRTKNEMQKNIAPAPPAAVLDNANTDTPDIPEFEVIKSTKFTEDDDNNDLKLYKTRGRHRGVVVVFSYVNFQNNIEEHRKGADVDSKMLKKVFSEIGCRVLTYLNLTYEETVGTLGSLEDVLENMESVFIVVSSHGYERPGSSDTDIRCSDGKLISFYKIMSYFNNRNLPKLIGIPKVFIFQVCRGTNLEYVWQNSASTPRLTMPEGDVQADGTPSPPGAAPPARRAPAHEPSKTPLYSDILIGHSTLPGCASFRNKKLGSWYIQVLCEVFAERAHNTHVDKLFTLVDKRLREKFSVQTSSVDRWGFNKRLYLHPGLFE